MSENSSKPSDNTLLRLFQFSTSFSLGLLAAFLYSVKQVNPVIEYHISLGTFISFIAVALSTWVLERILFRQTQPGNTRPEGRLSKPLALAGLLLFLIVAMGLSVGRALKNVSREKLFEIAQGAGLAFLVLTLLGLILWRLVRFLEQDHQRTLDQKKDDP